MFWTNNKILSFNKTYNYVIGERTGGKTFDSKILAITTFLRKGKQSVWIRREMTEFSKMFRQKFFDDVKHRFKGHTFEIKPAENGAIGYIDDKEFIFFVALSIYYKHKSIPFNEVKWVFFDEFIVNPSAGQRYLKGEAFSFFEVFHTVARPYEREINGELVLIDPKVRALFLGNSISVVNPHFQYMEIYPQMNQEFTVFNNSVIQLWDGTEHRKYMETTSLGESIEGTKYKAYAQDNEFYLDKGEFIENKTPKSRYLAGFIVDSLKIGVWIDYTIGRVFVNKQIDPSYIMVALHTQDHEPNILMIDHFKRLHVYKQIKTAFTNGLVRYSDHTVKQAFYDAMGYL